MDDVIVEKLLQTNKPAEKAAVIAKYFFSELPTEAAKVARQCIILHWFDHSIIEALLQGTQLSSTEKEKIEQQITGLPFLERLPWGYRYQVMTREGLLSHASLIQPELMQEAARIAAPVYTSRKENRMDIAEGFFCHMVAGNQSEGINLLDELMEQAISHEDWSYAGELLRLQDEAEHFRFVLPLPRREQHWIQRGTVHSAQGKMEDAIADYEQAIRMNVRSIPAYIGRGKVFAKQQKYKRALADYNYALKFEPSNIHIYNNRSAVFTKQGQYEDALRDINRSLEIEPHNPFVLYNKGIVLSDMEQAEQALAVYNVVLEIYPAMVEAHIGKGEALFALQRYTESLAAYEEAIRLDRYLADAQRGKGNALLELKRYEEAQLAYEEARQLEFYTTGTDEGAVELTPETRDTFQDDNHENGEQRDHDAVKNHQGITSPNRSRRKDRSRRQPRKRNINQLWFYIGRIISLGAALVFIFAVLFVFRSFHISTNTNISATATAQAKFEASATAQIKLTSTATFSSYLRFQINDVDYQGILNNTPSAVQHVEQFINSQAVLQNRVAGLVIVYDGAQTDQQINIASNVSAALVKNVLSVMGKNESLLKEASYYKPLFILGDSLNTVIFDVFLLSPSSQLSPTPVSPRLDFTYIELLLSVNPQGLINQSQTAINELEQEIRSQTILIGREVGIAIVLAGASNVADIGQAINVSQEVYNVMRMLGHQNFAFQRASYYDPLYALLHPSNFVIVDIFLFAQ